MKRKRSAFLLVIAFYLVYHSVTQIHDLTSQPLWAALYIVTGITCGAALFMVQNWAFWAFLAWSLVFVLQMATLYSNLGWNILVTIGCSVLSATVLIAIAFYIKITIKKKIEQEN